MGSHKRAGEDGRGGNNQFPHKAGEVLVSEGGYQVSNARGNQQPGKQDA
jgi:hypothetical protein